MTELRRLFPPKQFLRAVRWMVPTTALLVYLWGLMAGDGERRYVGGNYLVGWALWLGMFMLGWVAVRLQMDLNRRQLARRTTCPTCGQPMKHIDTKKGVDHV